MYLKLISRGIVLCLLIFGLTGSSWAGEPTDQMRLTTDKMISILNDPALKVPDKVKERRKLIRNIANERFDWREMARRSLAKHWRERTDEEKDEFVPIFTDLLEQAYMNRIENYSGNNVTFDGEKVKGNFSIVKAKVFTSQKVHIPVVYRLRKKGADWLVYDVTIEGVSLVNNYRQQFDSIILTSSYQDLVNKLKEKVAKN